jgi:hypothetical protein
MQAIEAATFGAPDVLRLKDLTEPVAGPGQVLIAVSASDVLFVDTPSSGLGGVLASSRSARRTSPVTAWAGRSCP